MRKLKDALLIKIQAKFAAVGDYLSCAANYEVPDQSVLDAINDNRDEVIAYGTNNELEVSSYCCLS